MYKKYFLPDKQTHHVFEWKIHNLVQITSLMRDSPWRGQPYGVTQAVRFDIPARHVDMWRLFDVCCLEMSAAGLNNTTFKHWDYCCESIDLSFVEKVRSAKCNSRVYFNWKCGYEIVTDRANSLCGPLNWGQKVRPVIQLMWPSRLAESLTETNSLYLFELEGWG